MTKKVGLICGTIHLDFYGYGNDGLKIRREHIKAHIALYNRLSERLSTLGKPYQIWMEFVEEDAGLDLANIHTPNPAEDNFPLTIANVDWNCPVPKSLKDLINLNEWSVGHYKQVSTNSYFIQSKNVGSETIGGFPPLPFNPNILELVADFYRWPYPFSIF